MFLINRQGSADICICIWETDLRERINRIYVYILRKQRTDGRLNTSTRKHLERRNVCLSTLVGDFPSFSVQFLFSIHRVEIYSLSSLQTWIDQSGGWCRLFSLSLSFSSNHYESKRRTKEKRKLHLYEKLFLGRAWRVISSSVCCNIHDNVATKEREWKRKKERKVISISFTIEWRKEFSIRFFFSSK